MKQAILDDLELELPNGSDDLATIELIGEELGDALSHELVDPLSKLLGLHGILVLNVLKELGGEAG